MKNININDLSLAELKDLLKEIKNYKNLVKFLWKRGHEIFKKNQNWEKTLSVEYFPSISKEVAFEESKKIFKNVFNLNINQEDLIMKENSNIKWWMRFYMDDKVVDLSYSKIESLLSK